MLLSDADVVWLRDPCPYLQCRSAGGPDGRAPRTTRATCPADGCRCLRLGCFWSACLCERATQRVGSEGGASARRRCEAIAPADVMVSSDSLSPRLDASRGASHAASGTFNTGIVFVRSSPGVRGIP